MIVNSLIDLLRGVRGNHNLRSVGYRHQYTEYELNEYIKCKSDPIYFINNYCKIVSLDHGIVQFKTFKYQDRLINTIHENRFTIGKIGRQLGKTTTVAAYITWYLIFNDSKSMIIN